MLQKTLLNIEGLGRELDPDLDLWVTAKPFLERWMSERIGWRGLLRQLRQETPYWMTMLPQLPRLAHQALDRHAVPQPGPERAQLIREQRRQTALMALIAVLLALIAAVLLAAH